jgi:hypothetical protein
MDIIQRQFKVQRGERAVIYPFTTYSIIFHHEKINNAITKELCAYLAKMFTQGVPVGLDSVSQQPELITSTIRQVNTQETKFCRQSGYHGARFKQHDIVQQYFLANDPLTIGLEVPVYDDRLLGHMDILRVLPDRVQILDFKPNAHKETKAASQILRYRAMLRKHMPHIKVEAAYFDEHAIYYLI